jgi:hypothetical protein
MLGEHAADLLGVQRVAAGPLEQTALQLGRQHRLSEQGGYQPRGVGLGQRSERDRGEVAHPTTPVGGVVVQLGTGGTHDQQRHPGRPLHQVPREGQQGRVGPVQILEHDHQRPLGGHGCEEAPPGSKRLLLLGRAGGGGRGGAGTCQPDKGREPGRQPLPLARLLDHRRDRVAELGCRLDPIVGVQDARLSLDHLTQRPKRDPLAVGKTAPLAPGDQLRLSIHDGMQLAHQPGLAHPGLPDDSYQLHRGFANGPLVDAGEQGQLDLAANQRRRRRPIYVDPRAAAGRVRPPDRQRLGLALDPDRRQRLVVEQPARRPEGRLAHHHPTDRGDTLKPGGGVDHVTDHPLARIPVAHGDDRLPAGHPDPDLEVQDRVALVELLDGRKHGQCRSHCPLGVVLVGDWGAEHRHHPVADELVERAPMALDLLAHARVIGPQTGAHILWIGSVRSGGEAGQVAKQHGYDPALLGRRGGGGS